MGVKIYASSGRVVGEVSGDVLRRVIHGSRHLLREPVAIAHETGVLDQAERLGAVRVEVRDVETGALYATTIGTIRAHGFKVNRGFGEQIAMRLSRWTVNGRPGSLAEGNTIGEPVAVRQLALDLGSSGRRSGRVGRGRR